MHGQKHIKSVRGTYHSVDMRDWTSVCNAVYSAY